MVWAGDAPLGGPVPGCVLEAAVQCPAGWLLFLTDDVPFEESLSIHLLGAHGQRLDSARIGVPYATDMFSGLRLLPPGAVQFRFLADAPWTLRLHARPVWRMPVWPRVAGVSRGWGWRRWFDVVKDE